jgi:DNA-binding LacI/PurR family transcriptional regulator
MQTLLCEFPEIDAVFVFNDQMALGAMQAAQKLGRKIPQTLGVVGYDNIPDSAFYTPPLTTVSQDLFQLGQMAVQELERVIVAGRKGENNMEFKNILLQPELVIRDSSRNSMIKEKEEV